MAVTKIPQGKSLVIEVRKGTDKNGEATFTNKSFSGVKDDATDEKVFAVASAISNVLKAETRNLYVDEKSSLINEA